MEIRITGGPKEVQRAVAALEVGFEVRSVSEWIPNRGTRLGRVYVDAVPARRGEQQ